METAAKDNRSVITYLRERGVQDILIIGVQVFSNCSGDRTMTLSMEVALT